MSVHYEDDMIRLLCGDAETEAKTLDAGSVQTIVTSPPYYGLRDYGETDQLGSELTVAGYVDHLVTLFRELRRVLADDGTVWLNLGDSYAANARGSDEGWDKSRPTNPARVQKAQSASMRRNGQRSRGIDDGIAPKNLIGVPWRVAFALQEDGWILRSDIVWAKTNPMPESVTDRPTRSHEFIFLLTKAPRYFFDAAAIRESDGGRGSGNGFVRPERVSGALADGSVEPWLPGEGRNKRDVWTVSTVPFSEAHFAAYPPELIRPCILAGSRHGDVVLDPFSGSGTTGMVATQEGRRYVGIDLNGDYLDMSLRTRFLQPSLGVEVGA